MEETIEKKKNILQYSELVRSLLEKRGITDEKDIESFLSPDYVLHTHDPFLMPDMQKAVERVCDLIEKGDRVAIYSDFDCDGIPGAALLSQVFKKVLYKNVETYIPHRDREGYGFHKGAIDQLAARDVKVIITIDVGTVAIDAVAHAQSLGIDVIVSDHHEIIGALPNAYAILNPKIAPYPFPDLCGTGVAFKFAQAFITEGKKRGLASFVAIPEGWEKWLLDLVAIATVADMVPLINENRVLAFWGLHVLRQSKRPGIVALCTALRLRASELTENDIGFSIAPRINAASRMDDPDLALKLLTTDDPREAEMIAAQLESLNASRKGIVAGIVREAKKRARARDQEHSRVIVLGDTSWKPALLGLAANSIVQEFGGVACLWGRDANGMLKGSCRSDGSIDLPELFEKSGDVFEEYGGHNASGGFSVSYEKVHTLQEKLSAAALLIDPKPAAVEAGAYDALVTMREMSLSLLRDISRLAPFGMANPKPVFRIPRVRIISVKAFGKEKNHLEVVIECMTSGMRMRSFDFFRNAESFAYAPREGREAHVLATLERDTFRRDNPLALRLIDILAV